MHFLWGFCVAEKISLNALILERSIIIVITLFWRAKDERTREKSRMVKKIKFLRNRNTLYQRPVRRKAQLRPLRTLAQLAVRGRRKAQHNRSFIRFI